MSDVVVPEWADVATKKDQGLELSALETFVYDNEPTGKEDEALFRRQLQALVDEVYNEGMGRYR